MDPLKHPVHASETGFNRVIEVANIVCRNAEVILAQLREQGHSISHSVNSNLQGYER